MKVYLVGGAVRDELMGIEPKDFDYVVVGSTPQEMLDAGYKQVGSDFPVFLHPITGEEYALARTEAKEGNGYMAFSCRFGPEISLREDLSRRDLTINAIAKDLETGEIIDPFGGQADIKARTLKPTTSAFSEDPVRVLRAARFLARYDSFTASVELDTAVWDMYWSGELDHLVPERVWLETQKALCENTPSRYFKYLNGMGIFPELEALIGVEEDDLWHPEADVFTHIMMGLDHFEVTDGGWDRVPKVRFGTLCHDLGKPAAYKASGGLKSTRHEQLGVSIVNALCDRLKVPNDYRKVALLAAEYHTHCHVAFDMKPSTIHKLIKKFKTFREFVIFTDIATCDKKGRDEPVHSLLYTQPKYLMNCYLAVRDTDTKSITSTMDPGPKVGEAIRRAEIASIAAVDKSVWKIPYDECHATYFKSQGK